MMPRLVLCVALATLALPNDWAQSAEGQLGPAKDNPELALLNQFAGEWTNEVTVKTPDNSEGSQSKGAATGQWILDGRFLQQTWSVEATDDFPGLKGTTIRTYDPELKKYRSWTFHSSGYTQADRGEWDEKARTFTWSARDRKRNWTTTTKSSFPKDGHEQWSVVTKDAEGIS
jgi:hypothetical protein